MKIKVFDATLRDGSHAIKHQYTKENIIDYCRAIDSSGVECVVVGHGNGLGASSLQVGMSLLSDTVMLETARANLQNTKLASYIIPGFGTIKDNLIPALDCGVDIFKVGCHCTEADTTAEHIEYLCSRNKTVYGVLMMCHMASKEKLLEEAAKMVSYGAKGVILMDSAGAFTIEMTDATIGYLSDNLNAEIGFHPHNNLGLAVANGYTAVKKGAKIIDGTMAGFGAGAGNCPLEVIQAVLQKNDIQTGCNLYSFLDICENIMPNIIKSKLWIEPISIVSGLAGVFSAFKTQVLRTAKEYNVDARDIFMELGRRKAVGGQEDMIVEIAEQLRNGVGGDSSTYIIGSLL